MKYAPIFIPTLCRYQHFVRLIESLKRNTWAKYTDIYIGLDYPPAQKYVDGHKRICHYLEGNFSEFASFNVIRHASNVGSVRNCRIVREIILSKYDRFIRTDDDAEFSPNFIEYMDKCLMEYEDDDSIVAVTGYSYPVDWKVTEGANHFKENFICPMWGTGFWREKFLKIQKEIEGRCLQKSVPFVLKDKLYNRMLTTCRCEYINLCLSFCNEETLIASMTDVAVRMYMSIHDKYVIVPTISKVRNWGFDGSGEYCAKAEQVRGQYNARNYPYAEQQIDESVDFELFPDRLNAVDENKSKMDYFEDIPWHRLMKVRIKIGLYKLLGMNTYCRMLNLNCHR